MNNKETLAKLAEAFTSLTAGELGTFAVGFFGPGGGTALLANNPDSIQQATRACEQKVMSDLEAGTITVLQVPNYLALVGLASGLTLGVYLMAKAFGLEDQILEGSAFTREEAQARLAQGIKDLKQKEMLAGFKPDGNVN